MSKPSNFYEDVPVIKDEGGEATLHASFTPNNGIRVQILDMTVDPSQWSVFDFTDDQAELIGQALVRWAQRSRAETEIIRCSR